jgi:hypothetical protein
MSIEIKHVTHELDLENYLLFPMIFPLFLVLLTVANSPCELTRPEGE